MIVNTLLAKFENAWVEVGGASAAALLDRREAMIELGGVLKLDEAVRIAESLLAVWSTPKESIVRGNPPIGGGLTYYFDEGEMMAVGSGYADQRIKSVTVSEDENGLVSVIPELSSPREVEEARIGRILARWAAGSASGSGTKPTLAPDPNSRPNRIFELPPFSVEGALSSALSPLVSPPYVPSRPMLLTGMSAVLSVADSSGVAISILINGTAVDSIAIPAGRSLYYQPLAITITNTVTTVAYEITGATNASGLGLQTHASLG